MQYALALAGKPDAARAGQVYEQRAKLSPYGLAMLGLALEQAKDARAGEIAGALEQIASSRTTSRRGGRQRAIRCSISPRTPRPRRRPIAVKFLSHQRPNSPLLPKAALWLMNHRNEGYWWNSTKQTAMVIYGLTDYLKATE